MEKKFFSIITVVLNARNDLLETIKSLRKQNFTNFEYIVIDGGSTDGTLEVINDNLDIINKWKSEKDFGIYDAMNKGLKLCEGYYLGMLNAGDKYTPEGLNIVHRYLVSSNYDFIFGTVMKKILRHGFRKYRILWNFDFSTSHSSGFFIKNEVQKKIGNYDLKFKISSDFDLFYRMIVTYKMRGIATKPEELVGIFKSGSSYSSKFTFYEHLKEETLIRINNKQNIFFIFMIYFVHFYKNRNFIENKNKIKFFFSSFFNIVQSSKKN